MQKNAIIVTIISVIAVFGFLFLVYSFSNNSGGQTTNQVFADANRVHTNDHVKWSPAKKVLLVEYADLQCPGCRSFHPILKQFEADPEIGKKVTFIYRHFPLAMHRNAVPAARAAEAAGKQGKFFEIVDLLYAEQDSWAELGNPTEYFEGLAKRLKLDAEKFRIDMNSKEVQNKIDSDTASGFAVQVNSTPTFFLKGKKLEVETFDGFRNLLKEATK